MNCHACGTQLSGNARFCHKCGAAVGAAAQAAGWRTGLPWGVAGAALGALIMVLALRINTGGGGGNGGGGSNEGGGLPARPGGAMTDISQMTPEEMSRRLFDRVMRLSEEGKTDSVAFFAPMALQVYAQLPALDNDARYDMGLLHLKAGDPAGALAQADTILRAVPTHLYGFMLRGEAYKAQGNTAKTRTAYQAFLKNESAERARQRPEYAGHMTMIDAFHAEAARQ